MIRGFGVPRPSQRGLIRSVRPGMTKLGQTVRGIKPLKLGLPRNRLPVKNPSPLKSMLSKAFRAPKIARKPRIRLNNNA